MVATVSTPVEGISGEEYGRFVTSGLLPWLPLYKRNAIVVGNHATLRSSKLHANFCFTLFPDTVKKIPEWQIIRIKHKIKKEKCMKFSVLEFS